MLVEEATERPMDNLLQEFERKPQVPLKHEQLNSKDSQLPNQLSLADQLDASSTTSFCIEGSGHEGLPFPSNCLDANGQDHRESFLLGALPDTLLSRGLSTGKDMQTVVSGYGQQKDADTELSTADISSQSFGVPDLPLNPMCSNEVMIDEEVLGRGVWASQPPRMRTYTKVCQFILIHD